MKFDLKDIGYIIAVIIAFLGSRYKIKEYIRDTNEKLKDEINDLKIKLQEHKSKDDLQQQVIDQIRKQNDELIPKLVEAINKKQENE